MEVKDKEQQEADRQAHKNNVEQQKRTNQILKEELEKLLQGPQQGKKWLAYNRFFNIQIWSTKTAICCSTNKNNPPRREAPT